MNIDLHCHSTASDGTLDPVEVVQRAHVNGVQVLALTDHDLVDGVPLAAAEAGRLGMVLVPGVEISTTWAGKSIHIVGLGVDPAHPVLLQGLAANRNRRCERGRQIAALLEAAGVPDAYLGALRHAQGPQQLGQGHFARYLVEIGRATSKQQVFEHWLSPGKPGHVPPLQWCSVEEAVGWIRAAGGQAVLAHPGFYPLDELALWALAEHFVAVGGEGIEVVSGSQRLDDIGRFASWARRLGLLASSGSDFHCPRESRFDLGRMPALPPGLDPVWDSGPVRELIVAQRHPGRTCPAGTGCPAATPVTPAAQTPAAPAVLETAGPAARPVDHVPNPVAPPGKLPARRDHAGEA